jgi:hypothetical protein
MASGREGFGLKSKYRVRKGSSWSSSANGCVADSGCHERIAGGRRVTRSVKWLEGSGVIVVRLDFVWLCFAMGTALVGCASIQQQNVVSTAVGQSLTAGIGDVVLRVEGRESMPNAFGRADLFGRTRPTGFTTIQYGGMQGDKIVLLRGGLTRQSDATTMNSTPLLVPTQQQTMMSGNVGSAPVAATATTTGMAYIPPTGSTSVTMAQPTIPIVVDWHSNPRVPAAGRMIIIETATPTSLVYRIE